MTQDDTLRQIEDDRMTDAAKPNLRAQFAERITAAWHKGREWILAAGNALIEAKRSLPHGDFTAMIERDLPFGPDTARRFIRIAADPKLSNHATSHVLPEAIEAMDALVKLDDNQFETAIARGVIHPEMTVKEAVAYVREVRGASSGHPRPAVTVPARDASELRRPITDGHEFIATVKGYRKAAGISQEELDDLSGLQDGYTGKIEVDLRRAIHESCWPLIGGMKLVMLLVPASGALRTDKCPCCGGTVD